MSLYDALVEQRNQLLSHILELDARECALLAALEDQLYHLDMVKSVEDCYGK